MVTFTYLCCQPWFLDVVKHDFMSWWILLLLKSISSFFDVLFKDDRNFARFPHCYAGGSVEIQGAGTYGG